MPEGLLEKAQRYAELASATTSRIADLKSLAREIIALEAIPAARKTQTAAVEAFFSVLNNASSSKSRSRDREPEWELTRLVLGVLVERGLPAELVWPAASRDFVATLAAAGRKPSARASLKSRSLLVLACLLYSAKLRAAVQKKEQDLIDACTPLAHYIDEVGWVKDVAQVLPDFTALVLHPAQRRGFRLRVHEVTDNFELLVLLGDALVGDGKNGTIKGKRPVKNAIRVLRDVDYEPAAPIDFPLTLTFDGQDGVPRGLPMVGGDRLIILTDAERVREVTIEAPFAPLQPSVEVVATLSAAEVDRLTR